MKRKILLYMIVIIIVCATSFYTGRQQYRARIIDRETDIYINSLYFSLNDSIRLLGDIEALDISINEADFESGGETFVDLILGLSRLEILSKKAHGTFGNLGVKTNQLQFSTSLFSVKNEIFSEIDGNMISEDGVNFLNELREDLILMNSSIYSDETKQENPSLSINDIDRILEKFVSKYGVGELD